MQKATSVHDRPTTAIQLENRLPELAIIIPTFNERDNIRPLLEKIDDALSNVAWEAIFVDDDSADGTGSVLHDVCRAHPHVRALRRIGRRGLSSAVVEGVLSTSTAFFAVMDADMQHDEQLLKSMLSALRGERADTVIGLRYVEHGSLGELDEGRRKISQFATQLSRIVIRAELTDPLSGFFMCRREVFDSAIRNLSLQGYKILLDIIASSDPNRECLSCLTFSNPVCMGKASSTRW